jgi:glycosyltransferase involved in cell wall biosynthesis
MRLSKYYKRVMKRPLVTIGIPFYNNNGTLADAIKSILAQTIQDWQLILMNDGSTDSSAQVAAAFEDPRIVVINDGRHLNLSMRLNQIISMANSKYIARMDGDDLCLPSRLEKQIEVLERYPTIDIVGTGICYIDKLDNPVGCWLVPVAHSEICREPLKTFAICHGSVIGRTQWFKQNRYNELIPKGQDFELWLRTYNHSRYANVPEPLYLYRMDQSVNLNKQLYDRFASARFLYSHLHGLGQTFVAVREVAIQLFKLGMTAGMVLFGMKKVLLARRCTKLSKEDSVEFARKIEAIRNVHPYRPSYAAGMSRI